MADLNKEKQDILNINGNILIKANPGTGKTHLLSHKYLELLKHGIKPEDTLCLTFTHKAKAEMESRIIKMIKSNSLDIDLSLINIHTFHSFALDNLENRTMVTNNLLRYSLLRYLKDNQKLNYSNDYLNDTIVPGIEKHIRFIKSFGIMPDDIDIKKVKKIIDNDDNIANEYKNYIDVFLDAYKYYEDFKSELGIDYADMLINFLELKNKPKFKHVLVDELQDVNKIEADIALSICDEYFAVGDSKQAIFGFQGGSIANFKKFQNSSNEILSENFRSSNEILNYAKSFFINQTKEPEHKKELKNFKNKSAPKGMLPAIYGVESKKINSVIAVKAEDLLSDVKNMAIIARTNNQILEISKELNKRNIEHSTTFFSSSKTAKKHIISFLHGVFSKDIEIIKNSLFTPFAPISLRDAFELTEEEDLTIDLIFNKSPEFKMIYESIKNVEDINKLFVDRIIPISVAYGKEFMLAALSVQESYNECLEFVNNKDYERIIDYLNISVLQENDSDLEKKLLVTSVHKAKGKEFDCVLYAPSRPKAKTTFQDSTTKDLLQSFKIDVDEEIEEEYLRIDFVAMTRAINSLYIFTENPENYHYGKYTDEDDDIGSTGTTNYDEKSKKAYSLFLSGKDKQARDLLTNKDHWLIEFAKKHFDSLERISFSAINDDPYMYLKNRILKIRSYSKAMTIGTQVHEIAENILNNEKYESNDKLKPYINNLHDMIDEIKDDYPDLVGTEIKVKCLLSDITDIKEKIDFIGFLDAVFKNGDQHLIVDWKTSQAMNYASSYRQQLELYRLAYAEINNIPDDNVKVAIGFVGLRDRINNNKINSEIDGRQPASRAINTISKRMSKMFDWKNDINSFFEQILANESDELLWKSIAEQYNIEK